MGIDRSTPDGAHAARERIQQTARRLCAQVADELDLSLHANYLACVDETVTAALRKLTGPAIAAESGAAMKPGVAAAKKDPPTTSSLVSRSAIGSVPSATRR